MNIEHIKLKTNTTILKFALPSIIAMILTALVTIVDGFYIGNYIGQVGIAAVNIGLPIVYIYLAFGIMIGVGGISLAGRLLGEERPDEANQVFRQTLWTALFTSVIISGIMWGLFSNLLNLLRLETSLIMYMNEYFPIMFLTYAIMTINITFGMFIRGEGKPESFMKISIVTVALNILLDYIFISKLRWGMSGIAIASLLSVALGLCLGIVYFIHSSIIFKFGSNTYSSVVLKDTLFNGSSELIGQLSMGIAVLAYNWAILREVGVNGVAAFTVLGYMGYIFNMIVIGFGQGASPLMSFAFGAKEFNLAQKIRKTTSYYVFGTGFFVFVFLQLAAKSYSSIFVKSEMISFLVEQGIRVFPIAFIILGINVIGSFYFTSIGKAKESALISSLRGLVILLIAILVLPMIWGMQGVWLVAPVTELLTLLVTIKLLVKDQYEMCDL